MSESHKYTQKHKSEKYRSRGEDATREQIDECIDLGGPPPPDTNPLENMSREELIEIIRQTRTVLKSINHALDSHITGYKTLLNQIDQVSKLADMVVLKQAFGL